MTAAAMPIHQTILTEYLQWIHVVDGICEGLIRRHHQDDLQCGLRCAACCEKSPSILSIEAYYIQESLNILPKNRLWRLFQNCEESGTCPFLTENLCEIYSVRPLACRVNGLPLLYYSKNEPHVIYCDLNFRDRLPDDPFNSNDVLPMHALESQLFEFNRRFIAENPRLFGSAESIPIHDLIRQTLDDKGMT